MLEDADELGRGSQLRAALPAFDRAATEMAGLAPLVDAGDETATRRFRVLVVILSEETQALDASYQHETMPGPGQLVAQLLTETDTWPQNPVLRRAVSGFLKRFPSNHPSRPRQSRT